jgi:ribose transport system ATP-binding protein
LLVEKWCSGWPTGVLVLREGRVVHEGDAHEMDESRVLDLVMEGAVA